VPGNPCIAVVSPFLDRRHGTERCTLEQVERLARDYGYEVHLYCQRVDDLQNVEQWVGRVDPPMPGRIYWHKVPFIWGPHLIQFLWWMGANRFCRWRDSRLGRIPFDLVYSPGINCLDADAITMHAFFHGLTLRARSKYGKERNSLWDWPRRLHQAMYYSLLARLEKRVYARPQLALAAVSPGTAGQLKRQFGRQDVRVIPNGIDPAVFRPEARKSRRLAARQGFGFVDTDFVVLLIGNDWRNKGLATLLEAAASCADLPVKLLVVGSDDRASFAERAGRLGMASRIRFEGPSSDVLQFYAAADAYASPSLLDSFALPVLEAMACGLPAVTSSEAGISGFLRDGVDGFVLRDPKDVATLARLLRQLCEDARLRETVGENAVRTARTLTWEKNAALTREFLEKAMRAKKSRDPGLVR